MRLRAKKTPGVIPDNALPHQCILVHIVFKEDSDQPVQSVIRNSFGWKYIHIISQLKLKSMRVLVAK